MAIKINQQTLIIGAGLLVAGFIAYKGFKGAGNAAGSAAVDFVGGIASGAVESTGEIFGIPRTDKEHCDKCKAEGNSFCASQYCSAGDYLAWVFSSNKKSGGASGTW